MQPLPGELNAPFGRNGQASRFELILAVTLAASLVALLAFLAFLVTILLLAHQRDPTVPNNLVVNLNCSELKKLTK